MFTFFHIDNHNGNSCFSRAPRDLQRLNRQLKASVSVRDLRSGGAIIIFIFYSNHTAASAQNQENAYNSMKTLRGAQWPP